MRVAVGMQKGGVGKTVTSVNLAAALAERGNRVLAIDSDPQGALAIKLGMSDTYVDGEHALYDVLLDEGDLQYEDLGELIVPSHELPVAEGHRQERFDVIPGHVRNFNLEKGLYLSRRSERRFEMALNRSGLDAQYDHIVIDTPPNLGMIADGALLATENVIFPSHANVISKHSLDLLFKEIDTLEYEFNDPDNGVEYNIRTIAGVINELANDSVSQSTRRWFTETFGEGNIFKIPDLAAIEHSIEYRTSVFGYEPEAGEYPWDDDKVAILRDRYDQLAQHVEEYA